MFRSARWMVGISTLFTSALVLVSTLLCISVAAALIILASLMIRRNRLLSPSLHYTVHTYEVCIYEDALFFKNFCISLAGKCMLTLCCVSPFYWFSCTANEGPVRIQWKCLGSDLCIPRNEIARPRYFQNRIIIVCVPIFSTFIYPWGIYIFPGSVCLFWCSQIGRPILRTYKSLTDTWM